MSKELIIVGLGPGAWEDITLRAKQALLSSDCLIFRTKQHPLVSEFEKLGKTIKSCDDFYCTSSIFGEVYDNICTYIINLLADNSTVHYAVPGHPMVLESTVRILLERTTKLGIKTTIIPGLSALDAIYSFLQIDPAEGIIPLDVFNMPPPAVWAGRELLLTQVYNKLIAGDVKLQLLEEYGAEHPVTILRAIGEQNQEAIQVPMFQMDWQEFDHLTSVYVPAKAETVNNSIHQLQSIIAKLRSPEGCPWDREQTHQSLQSALLEETYEVLEALLLQNMDMLCEELGDLLLQIVFHTQLAQESHEFKMSDVINGITTKMIRRHPHVFGDAIVKDSTEVLKNWEVIKLAEKSKNKDKSVGLLDNIPVTLPALMQAAKVQDKAARVGFDWDNISEVWDKLYEEIGELKAANNQEETAAELGDVLFAVVNLARFLDVDGEVSLLKTVQKFRRRFKYIEQQVNNSGKEFSDFTLQQLDGFWNEAKKNNL